MTIQRIFDGLKHSKRYRNKQSELLEYLKFLENNKKKDNNDYVFLSEKDRENIKKFYDIKNKKEEKKEEKKNKKSKKNDKEEKKEIEGISKW